MIQRLRTAALCTVLATFSAAAADPRARSDWNGGAPQQPQAKSGSGALALDEVFRSVEEHFPLLERAFEERRQAEGELVEARGAFDLKAGSKTRTEQLGFYVNRGVDAYLEQPTRLWGATVFSGYSIGTGNFGPWNGDLLTLSGGEWRAGFSVPLWRNRAIDANRAGLDIARLGLDVADNTVEKARLTYYKEAAKRYWEWLASGLQLGLSRELLKLATERDQQIAASVELGDLAPIERVDNQRAILERRSGVLLAEQFLEQAAIELSLFWRAADGTPRQPPDALLPPGFPEPRNLPEEQVNRELALALDRRPEIRGLAAKWRQVQVEMRLAENQLGPAFDLATEYSRDVGEGSVTKIGNELKASLIFELPFQRRKARGKLAAQTAKMRQLDADIQFARDRIVADVRSAALAVRTAYEQLSLVRQEVDLTRRLQMAETERFQLGDSTLFIVNLRELATASVRLREIKSLAEYQKAIAEYQAATTQILTAR